MRRRKTRRMEEQKRFKEGEGVDSEKKYLKRTEKKKDVTNSHSKGDRTDIEKQSTRKT